MPGEPIWIIFRWLHLLAGITWIGLLYYLNNINVRMMASLEPATRPLVIQANLRRVMAWFRHSAWVTVLMGLVLLYLGYWQRGDFVTSDAAKTIHTGALLGIIMLFNVWVLIWPNQKKIIQAARDGTPADPAWGRIGLYASRTNYTLSFPMLFFMAGARHYQMGWVMIIIVGLILAAIGAAVVFTIQKWAATRF